MSVRVRRRGCLAAMVLTLAGMSLAPVARSQVAPTASESAAYRGVHLAAARGDVPGLQRLLAAGADVNTRDHYGRTPLHVATFARQHASLRALAKGGADLSALEKDRYDAVTIAAVADDEDTLSVLLSLGASARQITSRYDGTALIAAAHLGHDGVVRQLILAGAPIDHVNNLHWTAVIESIVLGNGGARHQETLRVLIQAGADLRSPDRHGRTPLQLAQQRGFSTMEHMLTRAGAR